MRISAGRERWVDRRWSYTLESPPARRIVCEALRIDGPEEYQFGFQDVAKMMKEPLRIFREKFMHVMPMFEVGIYVKLEESKAPEAVLVGKCVFKVGPSEMGKDTESSEVI